MAWYELPLTVTPSAGFGQYSTGGELSVEYTLKEEVVEAVEFDVPDRCTVTVRGKSPSAITLGAETFA